MEIAIISIGSFLASGVGATIGIGDAIILLPIVAAFMDLKQAVAVVAIALVFTNAVRTYAFRKDLHLKALGVSLTGSIFGSIVGAYSLAYLPSEVLKRIVGSLLVLYVASQTMKMGRDFRVGAGGLTLAALPAGYISGIMHTFGPITAPFLLAYGLTKESLVGTLGAIALSMMIPKIFIYSQIGLYDEKVLIIGTIAAFAGALGVMLGKFIVGRLNERTFRFSIMAFILISALNFLFY